MNIKRGTEKGERERRKKEENSKESKEENLRTNQRNLCSDQRLNFLCVTQKSVPKVDSRRILRWLHCRLPHIWTDAGGKNSLIDATCVQAQEITEQPPHWSWLAPSDSRTMFITCNENFVNSVPNMGYSARTLGPLYTELTEELRYQCGGNSRRCSGVGSCILEGSFSSGVHGEPAKVCVLLQRGCFGQIFTLEEDSCILVTFCHFSLRMHNLLPPLSHGIRTRLELLLTPLSPEIEHRRSNLIPNKQKIYEW